jgi:hypothetical protein
MPHESNIALALICFYVCPAPSTLAPYTLCMRAHRAGQMQFFVYEYTDSRVCRGIPSPAVLALSGRGYAELRHNGVLRSWLALCPGAHTFL